MGINQTGGRKAMPATETTIINELVIEWHKITRQLLYTRQDNTVACFDRIVMDHVIINSRKYCIPKNMCKVQIRTQSQMIYKTQTQTHIPHISYTKIKTLPIHGVGQELDNDSITGDS